MQPKLDAITQRYIKLRDLEREELLAQTVRLIAVPLPPTPVRGVLYAPNSYESATFDEQFERDFSKGQFKCVAMIDTNQGPVFYMTTPLSTLVALDRPDHFNRYKIKVKVSAFCASVEYDLLDLTDGDLVEGYANKVRLIKMSPVSQSCHGGSHLIIPGAPYLTALLQYECAPGNSIFFEENPQEDRVAARYAQPWLNETGQLFPGVNWDYNTAIDMLIGECYVGLRRPNGQRKAGIRDNIVIFSRRECIGQWAMPYLQTLTRNILTPLGESNGRKAFHEIATGDPHQADPDDPTSEERNSVSEDMPTSVG